LQNVASSALYPNGTSQPSVAGVDCKVLRGWPVPADLDSDIASGKIQVSVYPLPGMDRNTSRFPMVWQTITPPAPTLTAIVSGDTITIGGNVSTPQTVLGKFNGGWYSYAVQANDTLDTVAAGLAAQIPGATSAGAVVTTQNPWELVARIAAGGVSGMEIRRQVRVFKLIVWAATPDARDAASQAIDQAFAKIERIDMPDGFSARVIYRGTVETDELERQIIYRRDLDYSVEYATIQTETETAVEAIEVTVEDQNSNPITTLDI